MKDEEIKRLLENVEVTPSEHCWEAIESNLAAGASAAASATVTKVAGHALSTTAKVLIGVAGTAAIATTAIILALSGIFSTKETGATQNPTAITRTTLANESTPAREETAEFQPTTPVQPIHTSSETPTTELPADHSPVAEANENPVPPTPVPENSTTKAATATNPTPQVTTSSTSTQTASTPTAPSTSKPVSKPAEHPSTLTDMTDPVLEDDGVRNNIDFTPPVTLVIPNIITPNGDGANDFFIIQGIEQCDRNRLIIRNSNGTIVFQTVNYQNNWDAPHLADGTYFYQFVYTIHGIEEKRAGTLTIMR